MNVHDPDDPETDPGRTSSPLPHRTTALDAHGPVPAPRTPGDGPLGRRPTPAPAVPAARHEAPPPSPTARHEAPPPTPTARHETPPPAPTVRHEAPPCTPPMPWSAVAAPAASPATLPPAPKRSVRRAGWTLPSWWPEVRRVLGRPTVERRVAVGLAVTVVLVGSAALALSLAARPPADEQVVAEQQAGVPATGDVADGATVVDGAAFGGDVLTFRSPTGNIECRMADDGSRCTIGSRSWQLPPTAPDCPRANGTVVLSGSGPAFASCEPSSARSAPSLDYDRALRRGDVTCVSGRDGVECRDATTGHGFAVARADYRVY